MNIAVASGKGGTGKTTVSANLARVYDGPIQLCDCDVEAPNAHLFVHGDMRACETFATSVPHVDEALCDGCNACGAFCEFNAIVSFGKAPIVFPEMCHGCGGCMKVCPRRAISETEKRIGVIETLQADHISLVQGRLDVGVAMAPPLIRAVKSRLKKELPVIVDAPPGASCPVIAALRDVSFAVLVTEPTPFGLHDLAIAVDMVRTLDLPFGVVINRVGIGDDRVHRFCKEACISILMEIPDDRRIAEAYSHGRLLVDALPEYKNKIQELIGRITTGQSQLAGRQT